MSKTLRQASKGSSTYETSRNQLKTSQLAKKQKRHATVYDAVAGRISTQGFIPSLPYIPSTRDTPSSSTVPIPPEEVLFRPHRAPVRYEENDIYWADQHLRADQQLPDSDLLKALHAYAADFYGRTLGREAEISHESLDGSALLALGVLMEEVVRGALGETGDLAFVEGEEVGEAGGYDELDEQRQKSSGTPRDTSAMGENDAAPLQDTELTEEARRRKKRKIRQDANGAGQGAFSPGAPGRP